MRLDGLFPFLTWSEFEHLIQGLQVADHIIFLPVVWRSRWPAGCYKGCRSPTISSFTCGLAEQVTGWLLQELQVTDHIIFCLWFGWAGDRLAATRAAGRRPYRLFTWLSWWPDGCYKGCRSPSILSFNLWFEWCYKSCRSTTLSSFTCGLAEQVTGWSQSETALEPPVNDPV